MTTTHLTHPAGQLSDYRCHSTGRDQPRMLLTHQPGCDDAGCPGCVPCPERHCQVCRHTHVTVEGRGPDLTCASCIGDTRTALAGIYSASARLLGEAIVAGINSQAAMLEGPAARVDGFRRRIAHAFTTRGCRTPLDCPMHTPLVTAGPTCAHRTCGHPSCAWARRDYCPTVMAIHDDNRDELHPLWVLGVWEHNVRDHLDQPAPTAARVQLTTARDYLAPHLTRLAHDPGFAFDELADDLARCHAHLENVLTDGDRDDQGAPCPACQGPKLIRVYADTETTDHRCARCHGPAPTDATHCPDPWCWSPVVEPVLDSNPADDRWTCPACHQWWTPADYDRRVKGDYLQYASALTASQLREQYGIAEGTVRVWANRGRVAKRGRDQHGRQLYDVKQAVVCRGAR
ncbi:hypothetical protein [Nocardioides sp. Leaf374]|uniref:hypothetical protein n=1 Tax=Nocardioides sp. Leaf374 TaxID=2876560 RepID=UPI001E4F16E3|nr:hypothetical protein [Nocardioides sp. Leaf374]